MNAHNGFTSHTEWHDDEQESYTSTVSADAAGAAEEIDRIVVFIGYGHAEPFRYTVHSPLDLRRACMDARLNEELRETKKLPKHPCLVLAAEYEPPVGKLKNRIGPCNNEYGSSAMGWPWNEYGNFIVPAFHEVEKFYEFWRIIAKNVNHARNINRLCSKIEEATK